MPKELIERRGKHVRSPELRAQISKALSNERSPLWKGENVGYYALHAWISKRLGRPKKCTKCDVTSDNGRKFHWANISGEYRRDLNDWVRLCVKCHSAFDASLNRGWKKRENDMKEKEKHAVK